LALALAGIEIMLKENSIYHHGGDLTKTTLVISQMLAYGRKREYDLISRNRKKEKRDSLSKENTV